MPLTVTGIIEMPGSAGVPFDHGAFDPKTRRVFVAHTGCNSVEVIDHDSRRHVGTLRNFPEAAGVVADAGHVLVTNRGSASLAWVDGDTLETRAVFGTGLRPNGVAIVPDRQLAAVACIGDETHSAKLQVLSLGYYPESGHSRPRFECARSATSGNRGRRINFGQHTRG